MRFRLTPRETSFYDMFAASADNIVTGSKLLMELLGADASARAEIAERMRAAEHAGDDATHAIFHQLNSSFITPFDREDIYNLASSLDDIMDFMEEGPSTWSSSTTSRNCPRASTSRSRCWRGPPS
ncbi:uncharacterized protein Yka (UPF0111/DUF47 family) [Streptomyces ambofaciens]